MSAETHGHTPPDSDLTLRLRSYADFFRDRPRLQETLRAASDEIEHLRRHVALLTNRLEAEGIDLHPSPVR